MVEITHANGDHYQDFPHRQTSENLPTQRHEAKHADVLVHLTGSK
jgi:hypothetical protein